MDRRTKFILLVLFCLALFAAVGWFIVWPTIRPLLPARLGGQPPALPSTLQPGNVPQGTSGATGQQPATGGSNAGSVASFDPDANNPDAQTIADLERRAGVLAERVESGSSQDDFSNLLDAQLGASPTLVTAFNAMREELRKAHPAAGNAYVTVARRLVENGEADQIDGPTFRVNVQLQVQVRDGGNTSTSYREATVTFTQSGTDWIASGYTAKPYTP